MDKNIDMYDLINNNEVLGRLSSSAADIIAYNVDKSVTMSNNILRILLFLEVISDNDNNMSASDLDTLMTKYGKSRNMSIFVTKKLEYIVNVLYTVYAAKYNEDHDSFSNIDSIIKERYSGSLDDFKHDFCSIIADTISDFEILSIAIPFIKDDISPKMYERMVRSFEHDIEIGIYG